MNDNNEDLKQIKEIASIISKLNYYPYYIIDIEKNKFVHIQVDSPFLLGCSLDDLLHISPKEYYQRYYSPTTKTKVSKIARSASFLFSSLSKTEQSTFYITTNFQLRESKKTPAIYVQHRTSPILLNEESKIRYILTTISLSSKKLEDKVFLHYVKANLSMRKLEYNFKSNVWEPIEIPMITDREKTILILSYAGYAQKEIASKLNITDNTLKTYKRILFDKLGVQSSLEALSIAIKMGLI